MALKLFRRPDREQPVSGEKLPPAPQRIESRGQRVEKAISLERYEQLLEKLDSLHEEILNMANQPERSDSNEGSRFDLEVIARELQDIMASVQRSEGSALFLKSVYQRMSDKVLRVQREFDANRRDIEQAREKFPPGEDAILMEDQENLQEALAIYQKTETILAHALEVEQEDQSTERHESSALSPELAEAKLPELAELSREILDVFNQYEDQSDVKIERYRTMFTSMLGYAAEIKDPEKLKDRLAEMIAESKRLIDEEREGIDHLGDRIEILRQEIMDQSGPEVVVKKEKLESLLSSVNRKKARAMLLREVQWRLEAPKYRRQLEALPR